jgi:hypothetical protein
MMMIRLWTMWCMRYRDKDGIHQRESTLNRRLFSVSRERILPNTRIRRMTSSGTTVTGTRLLLRTALVFRVVLFCCVTITFAKADTLGATSGSEIHIASSAPANSPKAHLPARIPGSKRIPQCQRFRETHCSRTWSSVN